MNFLRKKKNEQKDAEPEQDYGIRFNTYLDKRFLSSGFCHPATAPRSSRVNFEPCIRDARPVNDRRSQMIINDFLTKELHTQAFVRNFSPGFESYF